MIILMAVLYSLSLSFPPSISSLSIPSFIHPTVPQLSSSSLIENPTLRHRIRTVFLNYPSNVIIGLGIGLLLSYLRRILSGFNPTWPTNHVVVVGRPLMLLCTTTPHHTLVTVFFVCPPTTVDLLLLRCLYRTEPR